MKRLTIRTLSLGTIDLNVLDFHVDVIQHTLEKENYLSRLSVGTCLFKYYCIFASLQE